MKTRRFVFNRFDDAAVRLTWNCNVFDQTEQD